MSAERSKWGQIFKITNINDTKEMFIGATHDKGFRRFYKYKNESKTAVPPCMLISYRIKKVGQDNFVSEVLEERQFADKTAMFIRLKYWIDKLQPTLNGKINKEADYEKLFPSQVKTDKKDEQTDK